MSCEETLSYLELDPELTLKDAPETVARHVEECAACRAQADALLSAHGELADLVETPPPVRADDPVLSRIMTAVQKEPAVPKSPPLETPQTPTSKGEVDVRLACAFCHDKMTRLTMVLCAACLTPHHGDCFATHGTCSLLGCEETETLSPGERVATPRRPRRGLLLAAVALATAGGAALGWGLATPTPPDEVVVKHDDTPPSDHRPGDILPRDSRIDLPQTADVAAAPLVVTAELERTQVHDPSQPIHLVVNLQAADRQTDLTNRPPVRIALVVDTSSSMSADDKMSFARQAVAAFLRGLGPRDACTVIGFGNDVTTHVPWMSGEEEPPLHLLSRLQPQGGTNLYAAIEAGAAALEQGSQSAGVLRRVVVFTDGHPTVGKTDPESLLAQARDLSSRGISLSCHGFGGDIDASLLTRLSEFGGGTFLYVDEGSLATRAFEIELTRAVGTLVTATKVRIEPLPGVVVEEVISYTPTQEGGAQLVHVGDLPAGVQRKVVVRLRWTTQAIQKKEVPMARVTWTTVRVDDGTRLAGTVEVSATLAGDVQTAMASYQSHLKYQLVDAELAARMNTIQVLLVSGKRAEAQVKAKDAQVWFDQVRPVADRQGQGFVNFRTNFATVRLLENGLLPDDDAEAAACLEAGKSLGK